MRDKCTSMISGKISVCGNVVTMGKVECLAKVLNAKQQLGYKKGERWTYGMRRREWRSKEMHDGSVVFRRKVNDLSVSVVRKTQDATVHQNLPFIKLIHIQQKLFDGFLCCNVP